MEIPRNRWGRKRRTTGARKPTGRLQRQDRDVRDVVLGQPHRRKLPAPIRHDHRAESPLGALYLLGRISPAEYAAGKRFRDVVARYRVVLASWDPTRKPEPGGSVADLSQAEKRRRREAYDEAFEALPSHRAARAVSRVCVYEEAHPDEIALVAGLRALAGLWRLGNR